MKKITLTALLTVSLFGTFYAGEKEKKEVPTTTEASFKTGVWAEQKTGTYRESNLAAIFFGRCKKSTDQCMIIYHDGDAALHVSINTSNGIIQFDCKSYTEKAYFDRELNEAGMEYTFKN